MLGMNLSHGGHLTHGAPVNFSGKMYEFSEYGVDTETETIDYDEVMELAKEQPKLIIAGASAYSRQIDLPNSEIADEVGAYFMVDMAHIAGLWQQDCTRIRYRMQTLSLPLHTRH